LKSKRRVAERPGAASSRPGGRDIEASIAIGPQWRAFSGFLQDRKQISDKTVTEDSRFESAAKKLEQLVFGHVERTRGEPAIRPLGKADLDLPELLHPQSLDSTIIDLRSGQLLGVGRVSHLSHPHSFAGIRVICFSRPILIAAIARLDRAIQ
jgi:hypothetical protein